MVYSGTFDKGPSDLSRKDSSYCPPKVIISHSNNILLDLQEVDNPLSKEDKMCWSQSVPYSEVLLQIPGGEGGGGDTNIK